MTETREEPARAPLVLAFDEARISYLTRAGEINVIPGFSLEVARSEAVGLVGESGSGKSTLAFAAMNHLGSAGRLVSGRILFEGRDLARRSPQELRALRGNRMAMVYQDPMSSLNPVMKIGGQLMEVPMRHQGLNREAARARAIEMLREVELPEGGALMERYPHQLSGGQQQRVVIAMALIAEPALLILDEPTTGLDVTVEAAVLELIASLRTRHETAILFITHDLGIIARVCDRVAVLYAGELAEEGSVREIFRNPRHPYARALISCVPGFAGHRRRAKLASIPGTPPLASERPPGCGFAPRCAYAVERLCTAQPIALREVAKSHLARCVRAEELPRWRRAATEAAAICERAPSVVGVLEVCKLRKYFRAQETIFASPFRRRARPIKALDGVSLEASKGETLAVVGESGCGKSTLAKVIAGLEPTTRGAVRLHGVPVEHLKVEDRAAALQRGVQMVFQNPDATLNPSHSVGYALGRALVRLAGLRRAKRRQGIAELLELVKLPASYAPRKPRQLSGGEKQRVALARALAGSPELLIADEPVSALDVSVQAAIVNLLAEIQEGRGMTLLFISHDLALVRYLADSVAVMYRGKVMEYGPVEAVFRPPFHPYTEVLLSAAPVPDPDVSRKRIAPEGPPPGAAEAPGGCPFHARCPRKLGRVCEAEEPPVREPVEGHRIACHIPLQELAEIEAPAAASGAGEASRR